jgi:3-oxoacyl-(acyl-carrier-protein) synthase
MLLGKTSNVQTMCELNDVELMHKPSPAQMQQTLDFLLAKAGCKITDIDAVLTGLNTHAAYDQVYRDAIDRFFRDIPIMHYKHLFGESFSSSAIAVYVAATCLRKGRIPSFLLVDKDKVVKKVKRILVYNHYRNKSHSFILLSSCLN